MQKYASHYPYEASDPRRSIHVTLIIHIAEVNF